MAKVSTNNTSLRHAIETSVGTLPGSPIWRIDEFENITGYGAEISTVVRRPISQDRGRKKGTTVDLNSSVAFDTDLTLDIFESFIEGFVFAEFANVEFDLKSSSGTVPPPAVASSDTFTIDSASTLLAGKMQWVTSAQATLLWASGYTNAANNGLHVLAADVGATDTSVDVSGGSSLVDETPPTNARLEVCGVRCAASDLALTISGSTATIVSSADISDWSSLGLQAGMYIHVGSPDTDGVVQNVFDDGSGGDVYGYARISSISGATLNLDKLDPNLDTTDASNATAVDIMFGRFARNVQVTADSDDNRYLERTYQFEVSYPDLGGIGTDEYEYAIGNFANEIAISLPLTDKATVSMSFIGTNSDDVTGTRKTGAATAISPLKTTAMNTALDMVVLTTDVISSVSDVCFKSLTITMLNNVSPEKCLGTLGARFVNAGIFEVNLEGQMLFTNKAIINAIKNNTTVTFSAVVRNDNGAIAIDMPELTFGGGGREYPQDESVLVNITGQSFTSNTFGYDVGITVFPIVPYATA
jgi:hypothetical protein